MSVIQGGRWEGWARRLFSLKGSAEPQSVSSEIIMTAAAIPERPEDRLLRSDKMYYGTFDTGAVAGQLSYASLSNNSGSSLVTLNHISAWDALGNTAIFRMTAWPGGTGTGPISISGRDTRIGWQLAGRQQALQIRIGQEVAEVGDRVQQYIAAARGVVSFFTPIVLGPGGSLFVWNDQVNNSFAFTICWTEREAEPGELNL